jgi:peptidoglycan/xylan/chitin deacetylase (PgdA/CDA1 family)
MYHYVREDDIDYPYFDHLNVSIFRKQLDYFSDNFGFLSKEEYFSSLSNGNIKNGVVLTFDDGFKDHYKYVLPELKKRNIWGIFYVPTKIFSSKKILGVHRIQYLKGKYGAKEILDSALKIVTKKMLDEDTIEEFDKEIYSSKIYSEDEKKLRRLFNYYISYEYRDSILNKFMSKYFDEEKLHNELYLNIQEVKDIKNAGNIIGSHTVNHKVLSRLSYKEQESEIKKSLNFLKRKIGITEPYSFCYPYGYNASYNKDTIEILKNNGVYDATIFDNKIQQLPINRYELSRLDCNQFMEL